MILLHVPWTIIATLTGVMDGADYPRSTPLSLNVTLDRAIESGAVVTYDLLCSESNLDRRFTFTSNQLTQTASITVENAAQCTLAYEDSQSTGQ